MRDFWLNETGTPVNANAILQDSAGYLWAGADDGLYRFNGRAFTKLYDTIHVAVTALAGANGHVYAGFKDGGLAIVDHDTLARIVIKGRRPATTIRHIYTGVKGLLWLCSEEGVFAVLDGIGAVINTDSGLSDNFTYTLVGGGKKLIVGSDQGINDLSLHDGRLQVKSYTSSQGLPDNIVKVIVPAAEKNTFWIGTQDGGPVQWRDGRFTSYPEKWKWGEINDIISMPHNRAWVATMSGYLVNVSFDKGFSATAYRLDDKKVNGIALTKTGNVWCATNKGMTVVTAEYVAGIQMQHPYKMDSLSAMAIDNRGDLWFAESTGLYMMSLADSAHGVKHIPWIGDRITCLYADNNDVLWIGTLGKGVWCLPPGKAVMPVRGIGDLDNVGILSITGNDTDIWIAGLNGVEKIEYVGGVVKHVQHYNKASGIGSDYVYQLYKDRSGNIWMATDGAGICMYDGVGFHTWNATTGFHSKVVYSITQDANGNIWAATLNDGLYRYNGHSWTQFNSDNGLRDINVSTVVANAAGQVVIVHQKGIDEWYNSAGGFRHFNSHTGLGIDSLTNVLNCSANDTAGNVYIPYDKGFLVFKNAFEQVDFTPEVNITDVRVFLKSVSNTNHFPYDANDIAIRFDGISYTYVEQMKYRYMLEGYKNTWIYTRDEEATFLELPAGDYRFRVQASLGNNFDNYSEADFDFTIAAPFWKTAWFIILCVILLVGLTYLYIRTRESNLRKVAQLQEERMMFEYEHLRSQVNPHFLFNSLNTLASLIEEDAANAIDYTVQLSDLYRKILMLREKDLVPLREELEILKAYVYIQKSRFGHALEVNINISPQLLSTKSIVPLSLQLLVENAIKHNIVSQSQPLTVNISAEGDIITVRNNLQPKLGKEKSAGLGLINIYKRYRLLTKRKMTYGPVDNEYVVKLPLL
jgi:ligand-binding sensor domain-containing protein